MDGADRALPSPYLLTWSPLFVFHVSSICRQGSTKSNYRLFSTCFHCEELNDTWGYTCLSAGEVTVRSSRFSSLSAQHCCTQAGSTASSHLASLQDCSSNKISIYFVTGCGTSLEHQRYVKNWAILTLCGDSGESELKSSGMRNGYCSRGYSKNSVTMLNVNSIDN